MSKKPNNCSLSEHDPLIVVLYDAEETEDLFGPDHVEEFGQHVPEELIKRYQKNMQEFEAIQKELEEIRKAT